jgi:hypothetical protein
MRLTPIILLVLAVWFPVAAIVGGQYTPVPRPPNVNSFSGIQKHAEGEFMFMIAFDRYGKQADTPEQPARSPLTLYENEQPLGPAHSTTGEIKDRGGGRYLHLPTVVYFSTSDNTDPRTNGRQYSWTLDPTKPDAPR